jgi:predicted transposase YbfD/YdcC
MDEILAFLNGIEDLRQDWKVKHKLADIVFIVLMAQLGNADDWVEIAIFARANAELLRTYVALENGVPSHDTIQRVMSCINPKVLQHINMLWNEAASSDEGEKIKKILSLDGKTSRGSGDKSHNALHTVTAWSEEDGVSFGQVSADSKGKEIPMIRELLDIVSVKGQVVTIDAIGTQTDIAKKIRDNKGDYVLAVKGNQPTLLENISLYFADEDFSETIKKNGFYTKTIEKAHGRIEIREYFQTGNIKWLEERASWAGMKSIGMARSTVKKDDGEKTETRYFISSLAPDIELFSRAVRGHWSVESMHWHLDVTFREDKNRTLDKTAAENLNIIRKLALSILKLFELDKSYSLKKKRFAIGCSFGKFVHRLMTL